MLRDRGTRDGQRAREFVDGDGAAGELLEDGHARGVAKRVEAGL